MCFPQLFGCICAIVAADGHGVVVRRGVRFCLGDVATWLLEWGWSYNVHVWGRVGRGWAQVSCVCVCWVGAKTTMCGMERRMDVGAWAFCILVVGSAGWCVCSGSGVGWCILVSALVGAIH